MFEMLASDSFFYDATSALSLGCRERQEDAVAADFPLGRNVGFAVLSDGMGGHTAGDTASGIVVTEVFSELKLRAGDPASLERDIPYVLQNAMDGANQCVRHYVHENPETFGMGATLLVPVLFSNRLYWISVGDSPLFHFREGVLTRLNEEHSAAEQINRMLGEGLICLEEAENHPDRNCLTSVLIGEEIPRVDCRTKPLVLRQNDIVIAASDGLQFLSEDEISDALLRTSHLSSAIINAELLRRIDRLGDPDQDNVSICIIKLNRWQAFDHCTPSESPTVTTEQTALSTPVELHGQKVQATSECESQ